jgi:hypothetical protein
MSGKTNTNRIETEMKKMKKIFKKYSKNIQKISKKYSKKIKAVPTSKQN